MFPVVSKKIHKLDYSVKVKLYLANSIRRKHDVNIENSSLDGVNVS